MHRILIGTLSQSKSVIVVPTLWADVDSNKLRYFGSKGSSSRILSITESSKKD